MTLVIGGIAALVVVVVIIGVSVGGGGGGNASVDTPLDSGPGPTEIPVVVVPPTDTPTPPTPVRPTVTSQPPTVPPSPTASEPGNTVTPPPSVHVATIEIVYDVYDGVTEVLNWVEVLDSLGDPVPDARITLEVLKPSGPAFTLDGETDQFGEAYFDYSTTSMGTHSVIVAGYHRPSDLGRYRQ